MATKKKNRTYMLKWTRSDGTCVGGKGIYQYSLPRGAILGGWHIVEDGHVSVCYRGFHGSSIKYIHDYSNYGTRLWLVEVDGKYNNEFQGNKLAVEKVRFVKEIKIDASHIKFYQNGCDIITGKVTKFREHIKTQLPQGTIKGITGYASGDFNDPNHKKHFRVV